MVFEDIFVPLWAERQNTERSMKITKIKTNAGSFGSPVAVELDAVVERMKSPKTKEIADRIAAIALSSRIAIEQGAPRHLLLDTDRLPYLVFSTVFKQKSFDNISSATGLLLLDIPMHLLFLWIVSARAPCADISLPKAEKICPMHGL